MKSNSSPKSNKLPTVLIIVGLLILSTSFPTNRVLHSLLQGGITTPMLTVEGILPNSPASNSSLSKADQITSINGNVVNNASEFIALVDAHILNTVTVIRDGQKYNVKIMPNENQQSGKLGIVLSDYGIVKKSLYLLLPNVLIDSYLGWEEKSLLLLHTKLYKDQSLFRLKLLGVGIGALLIGLYLLLKKR